MQPLGPRVVLGLLLGVLAAPAALAAPSYPVERITLGYAVAHPELPDPGELRSATVELGRGEAGWVEPVPGLPRHTVALSELRDTVLGPSAVARIGAAVVRELSDRGLIGVYVAPDPQDVDPETGEDLRPEQRRALRLLIWVGRARELRTTAAGWGVSEGAAVDRTREARIRRLSPVQPRSASEATGDLMRRGELEDYVFRVNRHPRRSAQLALTAGSEPATVNLEYQVFNERPWSLFAEVSNTGTRSTGKTRHRLGLIHFQATGRDDVLQLDYSTASFEDVHGFHAAYEAPLGASERLRWRVSGTWSTFTADQLGLPDARFEGRQSEAGARLLALVFQRRRLFVDAIVGARWQNVDVDNDLVGSGDANFILPEAGLRAERVTPTSSLFGSLTGQLGITPQSETELARLGRVPVDDRTALLRWRLDASVFLDPLLGWRTRSGSTRRVHELHASTRGQFAFDKRLVPQHQGVAGGLYSVRGYPQSAVAGDTVAGGRLEYRIHLPRLLPVRAPISLGRRGTFRWAPDAAGAPPDWDLALRVFYDAAKVIHHDALSFEADETLASVGVGGDLVLRRSLRVSVDCGWALRDLARGRTESGDGECHVTASVLF